MKVTFVIIILTHLSITAHCQKESCYDIPMEDLTICPQCGTKVFEHSSYRGEGTRYKGECSNGVLNGKWTIISDDLEGTQLINQKGQFRNGKKTGTWVSKEFASPDITFIAVTLSQEVVNYVDGKRHGTYEFHEEAEYQNGLFLQLSGQYKNGVRFGIWKEYAEDHSEAVMIGVGEQVGVIKYEQLADGTIEEKRYAYLFEEKLKYPTSCKHYKNGLLHGESVEFKKNSDKIYESTTYKNGSKDGLSYKLSYKGNADTLLSTRYRDGYRYGSERTFNEYGRFTGQTSYKPDLNDNSQLIKHGLFIEFESVKMMVSNYKDGQLDGLYLKGFIKRGAPSTMGEILDSIHYKNGELHGSYNTFSLGKPRISCHYRNGKLDGPYMEAVSGRPLKNANYVHGKLHGSYKEYRDDFTNNRSVPKIEAHYKNDLKNGKYKAYDYFGNLKSEGDYRADIKEGHWYIYDTEGAVSRINIYENDKIIETIMKPRKVAKVLKSRHKSKF